MELEAEATVRVEGETALEAAATVAAVRAVAVKEEGEEGKALVAGARAWAAAAREAAPTVGCMSRSSTSCTGPG